MITVDAPDLRYTAPGVETLFEGMQGPNLNPFKFWNSIDRIKSTMAANLMAYLKAEEVGMFELSSIMYEERTRCPNQNYILGGYSQGAMVVNDYLDVVSRITPRPGWVSRIRAVVLVANPERVKGTSVLGLGTAPDVDGVCKALDPIIRNVKLTRCWRDQPGDTPTPFKSRTISICAVDDPICSTNQLLGYLEDVIVYTRKKSEVLRVIEIAKATHSSYKNSGTLRTAARRAAQLALS